jgi:MFS family permease
MVADGTCSKSPVLDSFGNWPNLKLVLAALFGATAGMTVVWYGGQFYALFFLTQILKVDAQTASLLMAAALVIGTPLFVVCGWISDRVGRKKIVLLGCVLAALTFFPIFRGLTHFANPAIEEAAQRAPVSVVADLDQCSIQFDLLGKKKYLKSCDIAKSTLARAGVPYTTERAAGAGPAAVRVGTAAPIVIPAFEGNAMTPGQLKEAGDRFAKSLNGVLKDAGYPSKADPERVQYPMVLLLLVLLLVLVALVYGPFAAWLVELFPARIRYTSMSVPYHLGVGWIGGFLPTVAFAIVAITGDIYSGLWYPVVIAAGSALIGALFLPDTGRAAKA